MRSCFVDCSCKLRSKNPSTKADLLRCRCCSKRCDTPTSLNVRRNVQNCPGDERLIFILPEVMGARSRVCRRIDRYVLYIRGTKSSSSSISSGMVNREGPRSNLWPQSSCCPSFPPTVGALSSTVTRCPRAAMRTAVASPPTPAPITTTSRDCVMQASSLTRPRESRF